MVIIYTIMGVDILLCLLLALGSASTNITVAIIGTNDIHGAAFNTTFQRPDTKENFTYGGLPIMATLIDIIRQ